MAEVLGTGFQRAGKGAPVRVGADFLAFSKWDVNETVDDLPTENFRSYDAPTDQAYNEGISGFIGCELSYGGDWDAALNPFDDPPGLYPRDDLADLAFFTSFNDNKAWDFPFSRVRSCRNGANAKDKVTFDVGGKSQGLFTEPTGSV